MKSICVVLRSGGDFRVQHVEWLRRQCEDHMPDWRFRVWSDVPIAGGTPLKTNWPKWWAKMEIFAYDNKGPILLIDLDTVFLKPFEVYPEHVDKMIGIRDPYSGSHGGDSIGGGFFYIPEKEQRDIWKLWIQDPKGHMLKASNDDQAFYRRHFGGQCLRFQDDYIDQVVSYKFQVRPLGLRPENRVVYFHGIPRPWNAGESWIPPLENEHGCQTERACG